MEAVGKSAEEKVPVPEGLRDILQVFAKETLTSRPSDVVYFGKIFFDELYRQKHKENGRDVLGNEELYEKFRTHLYMKCGYMCHNPPRNAMDAAATKIQAAFRGHIVRARPEKFASPATGNPNRRNSVEDSSNRIHLPLQQRRSSNMECGKDEFDETRAATKIQAEFRGYIARKHLEQMKKDVGAENHGSGH